jgi:hypothetical protein
MEEMVNDAVDSALDSEDMEEEIEEEVDKVLASVAGETASQLPDAVRKQRINQASTSRVPEEVDASHFCLCVLLLGWHEKSTVQNSSPPEAIYWKVAFE